MSDDRDSFLDLKKHRLRLEDTAKQLQKALQHWQTWDAEYEALKEEVESVPVADQSKELTRIHDEFEGVLLNGKEIDEVFGRSNLKTRDQIINVLERRIDYVTKNIESLQKHLREKKDATATAISQPDAIGEDSYPIMDIVEELDDDDNVISVRLNNAGESVSRVQKFIDDAAVKSLKYLEPEPKEQIPDVPVTQKDRGSKDRGSDLVARPKRPPDETETPIKKSVSFSDDTKASEESKPEVLWKVKRVEQIMDTAKEQETLSMQAAIMQGDESLEDAALRREMLKYGMSEIGAVVAELELEEDDPDEDYTDEGFDEEYGDDDDDDEDDEDQYGRYKGSVVTDQYRQRMLQLEKKLGIQPRPPQAKADEDQDSSDNGEGIGRISVKNENSSSLAAVMTPSSNSRLQDKKTDNVEAKKGVRFAANLDIAPENEPAATVRDEKKDVADILSDTVERSGSSRPVEPQSTKRASRFKKVRSNTGSESSLPKGPMDVPPHFVDEDRRPAPIAPEGTTIADTLVERESSASAVAPNDLDDSMAHREVADEYQRMRKKFIQREGGFLKQDESPSQLVDSNEDSREPISRFKAARLSRQ